MNNGKTIPQLSRDLQITVNTLRYWVQLLGIEPARVGRVIELDQAHIKQITEMQTLVASGLAPSIAAQRIGTAATTTKPEPVSTNELMVKTPEAQPLTPILERLAGLESAVMALVTANRQQATEIAGLRQRLEAPPKPVPALLFEPPAKVAPWSPASKLDPMKDKPFWYRAVCSVVSPERFRRQ